MDVIRHGAIFAIPLSANLGFLYGKLIYGSELENIPCRKKDVFVKVYDFHTSDLRDIISEGFLKNQDLFVDPFILYGLPKLNGKEKWHFLFQDPISPDDNYVPHYIQASYFDKSTTPANEAMWILMYGNINNNDNRFFPYYRVKHLPLHRGKSYDTISLYLTFEWLRRNGKNPDNYFEYNQGLDLKKEIKFEIFNMAVDYRTIPKEIRGRVAPE